MNLFSKTSKIPGSTTVVMLGLLTGAAYAPPAVSQQITCDEGSLTLNSPALPLPPTATDNLRCAWDIFAWNSFAALNWPADPDQRGFPHPDKSKTFKNPGGNGTELIWETFKEKREVFQPNPTTQWNDQEVEFPKPNNLWDQYDGYCTAAEQQEGDKPQRGFIQIAKFHNSLDETVEVASEALEPDSVLCQGYTPDCDVHGKPVGPRVWKGDPTQPGSKPVYYEVKVNYDFFEYVLDNTLYDDRTAVTNALQGLIRLPMRGDYAKGSAGPSANPDGVYNYGSCDPYQGSGPGLPCLEGSVHMKSAWIQFQPGEDTSKYHTTRAIFYDEAPGQPGKICMSIGTFGMIGLHAIQRLHQPGANSTLGGTFVFATWEHKEIIKSNFSSDYRYVNYLLQAGEDHLVPYPALQYAIPVSRMLVNDPAQPVRPPGCTLSQAQTCAVNFLAAKALAGTVWENYQLVGTQFKAVSSKAESDSIAQPYYLANTVIETNQGLQQFQGLPPQQPRFQPAQWCAQDTSGNCLASGHRLVPGNGGFSFNRSTPNITFGGNPYNMGGCMGCHGVAQQNGYAFSFVLLDGQGGALDDTEEEENIPPSNLTYSLDVFVQSLLQQSPALELDVDGSGKAVVNPKSTAGTQNWRLVPYYKQPSTSNFPGQFIIQNTQTQQVLTAPTTAGGPVTVQPLIQTVFPPGPLSQVWTLVSQGSAGTPRKYLILNSPSGMVLTVQNGYQTGTPVMTAKAGTSSQPGQGWTLVIPGAP